MREQQELLEGRKSVLMGDIRMGMSKIMATVLPFSAQDKGGSDIEYSATGADSALWQ